VLVPSDQHPAAAAERYLGKYPAIRGNLVALLTDGAAAYPAMLEAIGQAKRAIVLESYIFAADATGGRFLDALCERARAGVSVRVLVDGVGSLNTPRAFWLPLLEAGGRVEIFRPIVRPILARLLSSRWWRFLWHRDHRKLLVVDDRLGFIGGLNIGDDYAPQAWGGRAWHDGHARLEGPAARALASLFNRTWKQLTREDWEGRLAAPSSVGGTSVQLLEGRLTRRHSVRKAYLQAMRNAEHSICITNAYCIPDRMVRRALRGACRRGVKVQMLLAGATDIRAVQYASRALYSRLMRWGVEIYEWTDRVLHAKTAVIDGVWCSIGSYNLDRRSLVHNLEANISCVDRSLGSDMAAQFERDLARSQRVDSATWHRRSGLSKLLEVIFYELRYLL
jgi:cardiolipin synthase A/B